MKQTEFIEAGPITIGVEYRLLNAEIARAAFGKRYVEQHNDSNAPARHDRGVTLHVYSNESGKRTEHLRFDCFDEDPHYHYIDWKRTVNELVAIFPSVHGDPLSWALDHIQTRLAQMLVRANVPEVAERIDRDALEAALPVVAEAAYRARFHSDEEQVQRDALEVNSLAIPTKG
jgi:hypothetical protein